MTSPNCPTLLQYQILSSSVQPHGKDVSCEDQKKGPITQFSMHGTQQNLPPAHP